jgi:hypothetical protein
METSVFKPTACLGARAQCGFRLFFYSPHGRGVWVYESCRARGIANIRFSELCVHPCLYLDEGLHQLVKSSCLQQQSGEAMLLFKEIGSKA